MFFFSISPIIFMRNEIQRESILKLASTVRVHFRRVFIQDLNLTENFATSIKWSDQSE